MDITLLNTPEGEINCCSINDAEIKSMMCTEDVQVKIMSDGDMTLFNFDPKKEGFAQALNKTRTKILGHKHKVEIFV